MDKINKPAETFSGLSDACIESGNASAFLGIFPGFGIEPSATQVADMIVSCIKYRNGDHLSIIIEEFVGDVSIKNLVIEKICQYCDQNEGADFEWAIITALGLGTKNESSKEMEHLLKVAFAKKVDIFKKIRVLIGREYTADERELIVDVWIATNRQKPLVDILPQVSPAAQDKIIDYFASKGWVYVMGIALNLLGREQPTADELARLAQGVKAAMLEGEPSE